MRAPAAALQAALAADALAPIVLLEFQTTTALRLALYAQDVVFDGNTYSATDGSFDSVDQKLGGGQPSLAVTIQNVDRVIRDWLATADRRGVNIVLRVVMADGLLDGDAALEDTYSLDGYTLDHLEARLVLMDETTGMETPGREIQSFYCPWAYRGSECGYVGSLPTCDFTLNGGNGCRAHFGAGATLPFGGFPGRPQTNLAVW